MPARPPSCGVLPPRTPSDLYLCVNRTKSTSRPRQKPRWSTDRRTAGRADGRRLIRRLYRRVARKLLISNAGGGGGGAKPLSTATWSVSSGASSIAAAAGRSMMYSYLVCVRAQLHARYSHSNYTHISRHHRYYPGSLLPRHQLPPSSSTLRLATSVNHLLLSLSGLLSTFWDHAFLPHVHGMQAVSLEFMHVGIHVKTTRNVEPSRSVCHL